MKFVKGISLFLIYPLVFLAAGFFVGVKSVQFFYPGTVQEEKTEDSWTAETEKQAARDAAEKVSDMEAGMDTGMETGMEAGTEAVLENATQSAAGAETGMEAGQADTVLPPLAKTASTNSEKLCVDTEYVLEETDVLTQSVVETVWRLPAKYVGMDREQFLTAMENYEAFPPLAEMERGFVGLEVLSFSRERVVVQMNYQYLQPSQSFYLAVLNNEVVVYLEDRQTIYINTGIPLENLPEEVQLTIMQMQYVEDEESLYHFLETYSS